MAYTYTYARTALIDAALADARNMPAGAEIYIDPNVGGFAWRINSGFGCAKSGPIGYDPIRYHNENDAYDSDTLAVAQALTDVGYTVI